MSGYSVSQPFHLAFPVHDLAAARAFYGDLLGCPEGRSADHWGLPPFPRPKPRRGCGPHVDPGLFVQT